MLRHIRMLALGGVLAFAAPGCGSTPAAPTRTNYMSGGVTESAPTERVALSGVMIRFVETGATTTSNASGGFILPDITAGSGTLEASKPGYETATAAFDTARSTYQWFRLKPVLETVTQTVSGMLSPDNLNCTDDFGPRFACYNVSFSIHHAGLVDVQLSWTGNAELSVQILRSFTNLVTRSGKTGSLSLTTEATAGSTYSVWVNRLQGDQADYAVTIAHPN